jgi:hypothetical protein
VKRYAEGTAVTVQSSRGEITGILAKHGCEMFATGTTPAGDTLQFVLGGKSFRFFIARPTPESVRKRDGGRYTYPANVDWTVKAEAEHRRVWRAHVLLLKAKLEFIEGGDTTLENEFLPYAVLPSGQTVGDLIASGGLPLLGTGA